MIVNLTKSVPLKEMCRMSVIGYAACAPQHINITFSHSALIGFATELLWLYEDVDDDRELNICTHVGPAPSQAIGFRLTPDSPEFVLKLGKIEQKDQEFKGCNEINIKWKDTNTYYAIQMVQDEYDRIYLEPYELSQRNIVKINVYNEAGQDITRKCGTVLLEITRNGIKALATMLLVWANNFKEGDEYLLPHYDKLDCGYNLGVVLTKDSVSASFKGKNLGSVCEFDERF